ncbi:hypothetical protein D9M68_868910 [compost metagenome]
MEIAGRALGAQLGPEQFRIGRDRDLEQWQLGAHGETQHAETVINRLAVCTDNGHGGLLAVFSRTVRLGIAIARGDQELGSGMAAVVVHDRRNALPEALLGIDADLCQVGLHERLHRFEVAEIRPLTTLDVFHRTAPFGRPVLIVTALAPDANDENSGAVP